MNNLSEVIRVSTAYTRSINIERDSDEAGSVRPYVITTRAKQTLERIASTLTSKESPRAWALVGPYGAGKSAFGLFLGRLLGESKSAGGRFANGVLKEYDSSLHAAFRKYQGNGLGFCSIALTGSPEPLAQRLIRAMLPAAETFFRGRGGRPPKIIEELKTAIATESCAVSDVMGLMSKLQANVSRAGGRGVLLIIDELGKFLEYEARHRGATDIYLLQALAEHTVTYSGAPLVLIVLLHQSIELYAQTLGEQLRNEWKKVHGRFETIPFLETTEQTLRVMESAITSDLPKSLRLAVEKEAVKFAKSLSDLNALPGGLSLVEARALFVNCYPLHPVSLLLLPTLCQRVAQNERTLFSYLGSREPHGFIDSMSRLKCDATSPVAWIRPNEIYEYFILNQPGLMSDPATHRRWAEVVTALERLGDAPRIQTEVLKVIGLLNIIGAQGGLKASGDLLNLCFGAGKGKESAAKAGVSELIERSIIAYRRYSNEYRVWQGSDFDLDAAIRDQKAQIGKVNPADVLNEQSPLPAIVARRHAIETGNLRYFTPVFLAAQNLSRIDATDSPTIFVCLAETVEEAEVFRGRLIELGSGHSPAVICHAGEAIRDAVGEVLALRRVQRQSAELANDPVGQRELTDRLATSQKTERELIIAIFEEPEQGEWIIGGRKVEIDNKRQLQNKLSALLDSVYSKAPIIRNELINRERPSSTAMGGRKKLLMAMLDHADQQDLGIEKFPAEKAMYRAVLYASRLHVEHEGRWQFQPPGLSGDDVARLKPMWDVVQEMLATRDGAPVSIESIYRTLSKPPYGIKAGLLPILILAMYQSMKQELAITENGQFVPFLTREVLEGLIRDPKSYALQHFRIDNSCGSLFEHYAEAITGEVPDQANLISVLQPLAKLMVGLPDYTKQTKRISAEAQAVRNLFFSSKAPIELIFSELPKSLGFDFQSYRMDAEAIGRFSAKFKATLVELRVAYHALLQDLHEMLRLSFDLGAKLGLDEVRTILRGRCNGLDDYTIDSQSRAFIGRLVDPYGDEGQWLVSLGSFLARKPPEKWIDDDLDAAKFRLTEFSSKVRDLFRLQLHYEDTRRVRPGDLEASLVRIISTRDGERQALVTLDDKGRKVVIDRAVEISAMLESLPSDELKLATLAHAIKSLIQLDQSQTDDVDVSPKLHAKKGLA